MPAKKTNSDDKKKVTLDQLWDTLQKEHGEDKILLASETPHVETLSTGIPSIDLSAIGRGGIPRGGITELFGENASGKTSVALSTIAEAQRNGETCAFVDLEHAMDRDYAQKLGVDLEALRYIGVDLADDALRIIEQLIDTGEVSLIVLDSVSALITKREADGDIGDANVGVVAKLMSQTLKRYTGKLKDTNTSLIFINQTREKVGVMFGSPETTSGGKALEFYSSLRLRVRKELITKNSNVIGVRTVTKVVKSKIGQSFREASFENLYDTGIQREANLIGEAAEFGLIEKKGGWFNLDGKSFRESELGDLLSQNPDGFNVLKDSLYELVQNGVMPEINLVDVIQGNVQVETPIEDLNETDEN